MASLALDLRSFSAVCRSWRAVLSSYTSSAREALQLDKADLSLPTVSFRQFLDLLRKWQRCSLRDSLEITRDADFRDKVWGACVEDIKLSALVPLLGAFPDEPVSTMLREVLPAFYVFARRLFDDTGHQLPWKHVGRRKGCTVSNGVEHATTSLLHDHFERNPRYVRVAHLLCTASEDHGGVLLTHGGRPVLSRLRSAHAELQAQLTRAGFGGRFLLQTTTRGLSNSYSQPRLGRCQVCKQLDLTRSCEMCDDKRGWAQLMVSESLRFDIAGGPCPYVDFTIEALILPFLKTSADASRNISDLCHILGEPAAEGSGGSDGAGSASIIDAALPSDPEAQGESHEMQEAGDELEEDAENPPQAAQASFSNGYRRMRLGA
eukprot:TRINITY_DN23004_c0_g1_i3.p1 TRINITY_DN23004_c0_g1~~TRINITY_DN23004_c0_g1_i3.p1  ORF type:complete len:377 (+),score=49.31 TRINITY_DN23004_c0_g1_i3:326-1456(+)